MDRAAGQPQHRRGFSVGSGVRESKDEDLALFQDMRNKERNHYLYPASTDDQLIDATLSTKFGGLSHPQSAPPVARKGVGADLLNSDVDKNDYDWLLTPPGTPLFPSLDSDSAAYSALQQGLLINRSLAAIKTSRGSSTTRADPPPKLPRGNPSPGRRPSTPQNGSTSSSTRSSSLPSTHNNNTRPATPTRSSTPTSAKAPSLRPSTPTRQTSNASSATGAVGGRPVTPSGARPATPTRRPATPTNRPATPTNNNSNNKPSTPSAGRLSSTPTLRRSSSSPTGNRPFSAGSSNTTTARGNPSPTRSTASSGSARGVSPVRGGNNARGLSPARGVSPASSARGRSPSPRAYPVEASDDIPPNLRTTSDRPTSAQRRAAAYGASPGESPMGENRSDVSRRRTASPGLLRSYSSASQNHVDKSSRASSDSESSFDASSQSGVSSRGLTPERTGYPQRRMSTGNDDHGRPSLKTSRRSSSLHFGPSSSKRSLDTNPRDFHRGPVAAFRPLMTNNSISTFYSTRASGLLRRPLTPSSNASSSEHGASVAQDSEVDEEEWGRLAQSHSPNILVLDKAGEKSASMQESGTLFSEDTLSCTGEDQEVSSFCRQLDPNEQNLKEKPAFMMGDEVHHLKSFQQLGNAKRSGGANGFGSGESADEAAMISQRALESSPNNNDIIGLLAMEGSEFQIRDRRLHSGQHQYEPNTRRKFEKEDKSSFTSDNLSSLEASSCRMPEFLASDDYPVSSVHAALKAHEGGLNSKEKQSFSKLERVRDKLRHLQSGAENNLEPSSVEQGVTQKVAVKADESTDSAKQETEVLRDGQEVICGCGYPKRSDEINCGRPGCTWGISDSCVLRVDSSKSSLASSRRTEIEAGVTNSQGTKGLESAKEIKDIWYMYRHSSDYEIPAVGFSEDKMETPPQILANEVHMSVSRSSTFTEEKGNVASRTSHESILAKELATPKVDRENQRAEGLEKIEAQVVSCLKEGNNVSKSLLQSHEHEDSGNKEVGGSMASQTLDSEAFTLHSNQPARIAGAKIVQGLGPSELISSYYQSIQHSVSDHSTSGNNPNSSTTETLRTERGSSITSQHSEEDMGELKEELMSRGTLVGEEVMNTPGHELNLRQSPVHKRTSALEVSIPGGEASEKLERVAATKSLHQKDGRHWDKEISQGYKSQQCKQPDVDSHLSGVQHVSPSVNSDSIVSPDSNSRVQGVHDAREVHKLSSVDVTVHHPGKAGYDDFQVVSDGSRSAALTDSEVCKHAQMEPQTSAERMMPTEVKESVRSENPGIGLPVGGFSKDQNRKLVTADDFNARVDHELVMTLGQHIIKADSVVQNVIDSSQNVHIDCVTDGAAAEEDAFIDIPVDPCGRVTTPPKLPTTMCMQSIEKEKDGPGSQKILKLHTQQYPEYLEMRKDLPGFQVVQEIEVNLMVESTQNINRVNQQEDCYGCQSLGIDHKSECFDNPTQQFWNVGKSPDVDTLNPATEEGTRDWHVEKTCTSYPAVFEPTTYGGLNRNIGGLQSPQKLIARTPTSGSSIDLSQSTDTMSSCPSNNSWEDPQFGSRFWDSKSSSETARVSDVSEPPLHHHHHHHHHLLHHPVEVCAVAVVNKEGPTAKGYDNMGGNIDVVSQQRSQRPDVADNRQSPDDNAEELFDYIFDYLGSKKNPSSPQQTEAPTVSKMVIPEPMIVQEETQECDLSESVPPPLPIVDDNTLSKGSHGLLTTEEKEVEIQKTNLPTAAKGQNSSQMMILKKSSADVELPDVSNLPQPKMVHSPAKEEIVENAESPGPNARKHMSSFKFSHKKSSVSETKRNGGSKMTASEVGNGHVEHGPSSSKMSKEGGKHATTSAPQLTKGRSIRAASPARAPQGSRPNQQSTTLGANSQMPEAELSIQSRFSNITVRSGPESENFEWARSSLEETSSRSGSSPGSNTETVAVLRGATLESPTVDQLEEPANLAGEEVQAAVPLDSVTFCPRKDTDEQLMDTANTQLPEGNPNPPYPPTPNSSLANELSQLSEPDCRNPMEAHSLEPGGWKGENCDQRNSPDTGLTITVRRALNYTTPKQNLDKLSEKLERLEKFGAHVLRSPQAQFMCSPSKQSRPGGDGETNMHPAETVRLGSDQESLKQQKNRCRCTIL